MNRFHNILAVSNSESATQLAVDLAAKLAQHNRAKLTVVDRVREFGWLKRIAMPKYQELESKLVDEKKALLESLIAPIREAGIEVSSRVLVVGKSSHEIVRQVQRAGHDLVIKEAKGTSGFKGFFGTTGTQLLRLCPCPVWLLSPEHDLRHKRVLACVDAASYDESHKELNQKIMDLATSFCAREGSRLDVVQVWSYYGDTLLASHMDKDEFDDLVKNHEEYVTRCVDNLLEDYDLNSDSANVHLVRGDAGLVIPQMAEQEGIDLIVMGTVARTGIPGMVMGNTAETILSKVKCSVLAVKPDDFLTPIKVE